MLVLPQINKINRSSQRRCSIKKMFLKVLQNSQENTCCQSMKLQATGCVFCEFSEIFNSTFFIEHLRATASGSIIHQYAIAIVFIRPSSQLITLIISSPRIYAISLVQQVHRHFLIFSMFQMKLDMLLQLRECLIFKNCEGQ